MMIETSNLTKQYGDFTAVDSADIEVSKGEIHGFVGPNGAGKSTTMQMLVGLISPTEGEAYIDGEPAGSLAATEKIGYAPQHPAFYESMAGRDYLVYMGKMAGMGAEAGDRADELLEWLDLTDAADKAIGGYSGGMARKLSLAQAMIHEPELLILDEPTATLDPKGRAAIIDSLQDLTEEGMTVFVSSHVLAELEQFIDQVTIIIEGGIERSAPLDELETGAETQTYAVDSTDNDALHALLEDHEMVQQVTLRDEDVAIVTDHPSEFTAELQKLMADEGITLQSLEEEGGLEETFLDMLQEGED